MKGGDGDAPRVRPCPGFPPRIEYGAGFSRERRVGGGGSGPARAVVGCEGDAPRVRPGPGFPLSRDGTTSRGARERRGVVKGGDGDRPARPPLPWGFEYGAGFSRERRVGGRGVPARGVVKGRRGRPARPALGSRFRGNDGGGRGNDEWGEWGARGRRWG